MQSADLMAAVPVPGYPLLVAYAQQAGDVVHYALADSGRSLCGTNGTGAFMPAYGSWICGKCRGALKLMELWPVPLYSPIIDRKYRQTPRDH